MLSLQLGIRYTQSCDHCYVPSSRVKVTLIFTKKARYFHPVSLYDHPMIVKYCAFSPRPRYFMYLGIWIEVSTYLFHFKEGLFLCGF